MSRVQIDDGTQDSEHHEVDVGEAVRAALGEGSVPLAKRQPSSKERNPQALATAYLKAVQAKNTTRSERLGSELGDALAGERLTKQKRAIRELERENRALEKKVERLEATGLLSLLWQVADELGIGFGWAGLYFTFFVVRWRGRTPGKRLLRLRIVRLDGKPLGLWSSFNRFGGYAASIFTGLLGFAEMFWDPNRQALHDRIAGTVVIHETRQATRSGD